jgi:hypothetical protein
MARGWKRDAIAAIWRDTEERAAHAAETAAEAEKIRENRLRRMASRQGLRLTKSRARDTRALDYGTYGLMALATNTVVAGNPSTGYGLSLDEIEKALLDDSGTSLTLVRHIDLEKSAIDAITAHSIQETVAEVQHLIDRIHARVAKLERINQTTDDARTREVVDKIRRILDALENVADLSRP